MRKMAPIKFTPEDRSVIDAQVQVQEPQKGTPKSLDPTNYPVWSIPVGKKVFIYVPNHVVTGKDGVVRLRMDTPLIHSVTIGKRYLAYRCTANIVSENNGLDGSCPLCEGVSEPWDLANAIIKSKCQQQGLDPEDKDNESVKAIRSAAFSDRKVKDSDRHYIFPIVVFETKDDDGKTLIRTDDGKGYKYKVYWYDISETAYADKWEKCLEGLEDEPTHPGGRFFQLNYIYTPKNGGQQNIRDAARNLVVNARNVSGSESIRRSLDKATEEWTPAKCQETVCAAAFYSVEDLRDVADEALASTRNLLELYNAKDGASGAIADNTGGFKLAKPKDDNDEDSGSEAGSGSGSGSGSGDNGSVVADAGPALETDLDME